jgi:hypothetical protein
MTHLVNTMPTMRPHSAFFVPLPVPLRPRFRLTHSEQLGRFQGRQFTFLTHLERKITQSTSKSQIFHAPKPRPQIFDQNSKFATLPKASKTLFQSFSHEFGTPKLLYVTLQ